MAPAHAVSGAIPRSFPVEGQFGAMRDRGVTAFHVISIATVFAFILILTIGAYP